MSDLNDHLIVYFASAPPASSVEAVRRIILDTLPSRLDVNVLMSKSNAKLTEKNSGVITNIIYLSSAGQETAEKKMAEKNGCTIDFIVKFSLDQHDAESNLSEKMQHLKETLQGLTAKLDDEKDILMIYANEHVFMSIPYSDIKKSGRGGTQKGICGYLKEKFYEKLSKEYQGEKDLFKLIGNMKSAPEPEWYKSIVTAISGVYWDKVGLLTLMHPTTTEPKDKPQPATENKGRIDWSKVTKEQIYNAAQTAKKLGTDDTSWDNAAERKGK